MQHFEVTYDIAQENTITNSQQLKKMRNSPGVDRRGRSPCRAAALNLPHAIDTKEAVVGGGGGEATTDRTNNLNRVNQLQLLEKKITQREEANPALLLR